MAMDNLGVGLHAVEASESGCSVGSGVELASRTYPRASWAV